MPRNNTSQMETSRTQQNSQRKKSRGNTPGSQSQSRAGAATAVSLDKRVSEMVWFFLLANRTKKLIKKQDVVKSVYRDEPHNDFGNILQLTDRRLQDTFGMKIVETTEKRGFYILVNKLNAPDSSHVEWSGSEKHSMEILAVVLTTIYMSSPKELTVEDSVIYNSLAKLDIDVEVRHPLMGDVKKLLTVDFVQQRYLELFLDKTCDPHKTYFQWGFRAKNEVDVATMLKFGAKVSADNSEAFKTLLVTLEPEAEEGEGDEDDAMEDDYIVNS